MSSLATKYEHILLRGDGIAIIENSNMKVAQLVSEMMAYGWSPEELHFQHPHLSLGQIYSALAYYWDNQEEMNKAIESDLEEFDNLRESRKDSSLTARLKVQGLLK